MKEKLEKLSLVSLKQIAKELGLKNVSTLKKSMLIDVLVETAKTDDRVEKLLSEPEEKKKIIMVKPEKNHEPDEVEKLLMNETQQQRYERYERYISPSSDLVKENNDKKVIKNEDELGETIKEEKPIEKHITRYIAKDNQREPRRSYYSNRDNNNRSNSYESRNYNRYGYDRNNQSENSYNRNDSQDNRFEDRNDRYENRRNNQFKPLSKPLPNTDVKLEDGETMADGILEVLSDGYGFIRCENFLPGDNDVYVSPTQIRKFNLKTGDILTGPCKLKTATDKFRALQYLVSINGLDPSFAAERPAFEKLTPIFPNERIYLEPGSGSVSMRMVDLISPIGKGQRGMIVSQPKSGKTTLLKQIAKSIVNNNPEMHLIILLIDERPEEVTDMKESIIGDNVEVIYSTFDELPDRHRRVSEMVIERAKRLVEQQEDVIILLDSITRLARAYNLTVQASGRTLSGGLDPAALHMPKKFFGAARNMREGGSLTILATALVDTGSKMDDVVFEEFKGTGNMELVLDRKLSEKRVFPAIDVIKSSTRREDLLLEPDELEAVNIVRKGLNSSRSEESAERVIDLFAKTRSNADFINRVIKERYI